jgi:N-acyl-D-aspartate/D-glutamate deacylase
MGTRENEPMIKHQRMRRRRLRSVGFGALLLAGIAVVGLFLNFNEASGRQVTYDVVISGGRVIDPESGLDAIRSIGIAAGKVAEISSTSLKGVQTVDASGLVVSPGFIDLHSHGQDEENYAFKAMDGVTTALELEVGTAKVADWYKARQGQSRTNFGISSGHIPARIEVTGDTGTFLPRDEAVKRVLTPVEQQKLSRIILKGLDEGAIGVGLGIAYVPAATRAEILEVFRLAASKKVTCFVHLRSHGAIEPGGAIDATKEALDAARETGASLHIVHMTSTGLSVTPRMHEMILEARRQGLDVTTEAYPYTAAMTGIETAIFGEGWQQKMGIGYNALQWVATGERLTADSFAKYRKQGGMVVIHSIPESATDLAIRHPQVMIASDGILTGGKGHPRGAGTFARVLGRYVREKNAISLMEAIRKMSLMPSERLAPAVPAMKTKGRIRAGADADLVLFDPSRVIDKATFENPAQYSEGFVHVLVGGDFVVRSGKLVEGARPGKAIRR